MPALLEVRELKKYYHVRRGLAARGQLHAVDDVSFSLRANETIGLVGESGCGKSTLVKTIMRLEEPMAGEVRLAGEDLVAASAARLRQIRPLMQMVFQDPNGSLNPRMRVGNAVAEPLRLHKRMAAREARERVADLFNLVGLKPTHMDRYPHQLSGGQQQRVCIARALATSPLVVLLDEPTSCLDVSVQAQLLGLFAQLQEQYGLSYVFVSHDLSLVSIMADWTAVMYLGQIVEFGPTFEVLSAAHHPYTKALVAAATIGQSDLQQRRFMLGGEPTSAIDPAGGCRLVPRCPFVEERCSLEDQRLVPSSGACVVRCWKWMNLDLEVGRSRSLAPPLAQ
jgi:peptide/nickel transport system ATP-binding protein